MIYSAILSFSNFFYWVLCRSLATKAYLRLMSCFAASHLNKYEREAATAAAINIMSATAKEPCKCRHLLTRAHTPQPKQKATVRLSYVHLLRLKLEHSPRMLLIRLNYLQRMLKKATAWITCFLNLDLMLTLTLRKIEKFMLYDKCFFWAK